MLRRVAKLPAEVALVILNPLAPPRCIVSKGDMRAAAVIFGDTFNAQAGREEAGWLYSANVPWDFDPRTVMGDKLFEIYIKEWYSHKTFCFADPTAISAFLYQNI
jgi:hypothetical protein